MAIEGVGGNETSHCVGVNMWKTLVCAGKPRFEPRKGWGGGKGLKEGGALCISTSRITRTAYETSRKGKRGAGVGVGEGELPAFRTIFLYKKERR